ncbi:Proteophosphoglycan ppg4 [Rhodotorula diobovata]|uniref:Proteophosphoglycan ppg4 n=1 Tax=Rhodotorula diobovata TaxID=5288 RepID=A0A5C5FYJ7_9BASI|nr:Proteophosphoglycan ppg4 [Rhodotorula diobovata]
MATAESPYAAVLAALERELRPAPSPGFRSRALSLQALTAAYIVLSLVYLAFLRYCAERSPHLSTPLPRRVTLPAGRLLVLDTTYFLPCTTIAVGVLSLGNVAALSSEDVDAGTGVHFALRAFRGVLLFLQGWGMSSAALQASWAAARHKRPDARTANLVFLGVGSCGVLVGLAAGLSTLVAGERVNAYFAWIRSALRVIEENQPTASVAAVIRISPGVNALRDAVQELRATMLAAFAVLSTMVLCVFTLCIHGLCTLAAPESAAPPIQLPSTPPISPADMEKSDFIEDLSVVQDGELVDFDGLRVEKARDDLAVTCLTVGLLSVVMACGLAFSINLAIHDQLFGVSSFASELAHLTFAFFYAVAQLVTLSILLHHLLTERTSPALPSTPGALYPFVKGRLAPSSRVVRRLRAARTSARRWAPGWLG